MSNEQDKFKKSRRLQREENAIQKQVKIINQHVIMPNGHGIAPVNKVVVDQPHRFAKHHAMDCGNPQCLTCSSNKIFNRPTIQEQRFYQTEKLEFDLDS